MMIFSALNNTNYKIVGAFTFRYVAWTAMSVLFFFMGDSNVMGNESSIGVSVGVMLTPNPRLLPSFCSIPSTNHNCGSAVTALFGSYFVVGGKNNFHTLTHPF